MLAYIVRRIAMMVPVVFGHRSAYFFFYFALRRPIRPWAIAGKHRSEAELRAIRHRIGTDKPLWFNPAAASERGAGAFFDTQFFDILLFRFPESIHFEEPVWDLFKRKAPISFAVQFPIFIVALGVELVLAIASARHRGKAVDWGHHHDCPWQR